MIISVHVGFNFTIGYVISYSCLGQREAAINVAEGKKQSQILASEARKMEQINLATGNYM